VAAREAEKEYVQTLAHDLAHFPPSILDAKIADAVFHAFCHRLEPDEIHALFGTEAAPRNETALTRAG